MMILKLIAVIILWLYAGVSIYAIIGFIKTKFFTSNPAHKNSTTCTIIICARNESKYIGACLQNIFTQWFDKTLLEIIFVNDASDDDTEEKAKHLLANSGIKYQMISNEKKLGKKQSIANAIEICNGNLIITRDADTFTESDTWLKTIVDFYEVSGKQFIIAPLQYQNKGGILGQLQIFENAALTIFTAGFAFYKKAFLCSGANLAFSKSLFKTIKGYSNHIQVPSGDDVLFLEDVKRSKPETIAYLKQKEASVFTYPEKNLPNLIRQKIRWASKFEQNPNKINGFLGVLVVFIHILSLFYLISPIIKHHIPTFGIIFISVRLVIDFLLLFLASRYFRKNLNWLMFLPLSLIYSFFSIVIGFLSLFVKPNWK